MSDYDFSYDDLDSMINDASKDFDFSNYFTSSDLSNINGLDLPGDFNIDPGAFSFDGIDGIDAMLNDVALGRNGFYLDDILADAGGVDLSAPLLTPDGIDESFTGNLSEPEFDRYLKTLDSDYKSPLADLPGQEMQITPENQASFEKNLTDIVDNRDGMTSQWQKVGSDRVMVNDDGTGIGKKENGETYPLTTAEVGDMIKSGKLNTFASGYNTATGGNKIAPGGGSAVTLKNGKTGTLLPSGKVIDSNTGSQIGTDKDVKTTTTTDGDGKKITLPSGTNTGAKDNSLGTLLPLLLALLAMNKSGGGGSGQSTVIPGLTATQRQTPYSQQQKAPGYRSGQGGISYFEPTQYTPKMAAGGIARLLDGPGDGVSDSIPAVIDGGMAGGGQPAKVARGEYIIDARTVAALGNGSTDAGAERLDKMRQNILRDDRKAGVGKDSKAYRHLLA
jgi:hypothetical protein